MPLTCSIVRRVYPCHLHGFLTRTAYSCLMSNEPFHIEVDTARKLITVTCAGLWDTATVGDVERGMQDAVDRLSGQGCGRHDLLVLIDRRLQGAQTQDVVAALQRVAHDNADKALRTAILVTGMLNKLQSDRIAVGLGIFTDESDALHWLRTGDRRRSAA